MADINIYGTLHAATADGVISRADEVKNPDTSNMVNVDLRLIREDMKKNFLAVSFDRSTGHILGTTSDQSRITSCTQDRTTGKITMNHIID